MVSNRPLTPVETCLIAHAYAGKLDTGGIIQVTEQACGMSRGKVVLVMWSLIDEGRLDLDRTWQLVALQPPW